jgi:predicted RecA/RadA family phage recombinase
MRNYIGIGDIWSIPAPADVVAGSPLSVGVVVLVALETLTSGQEGAFLRRGMVDLPKASGTSFGVGDACYLVDGSGEIDSTGDTYAGVVVQAADTGDATVRIELAASGPQGIQGEPGAPG